MKFLTPPLGIKTLEVSRRCLSSEQTIVIILVVWFNYLSKTVKHYLIM